MKIGELEIATGAPNAERLLALTGCTIAAMRDLLSGELIASTVARALVACTDEEHKLAELSCAIASEGVDSIRKEVAKLYADGPSATHEAEAALLSGKGSENAEETK